MTPEARANDWLRKWKADGNAATLEASQVVTNLLDEIRKLRGYEETHLANLERLREQLAEAHQCGEYAWQVAQSMLPPEALEAAEAQLRAYRELWLVEKRELADRIWRLTNLPFTDDDRRAIQHEALKAAGEADAALREVPNG